MTEQSGFSLKGKQMALVIALCSGLFVSSPVLAEETTYECDEAIEKGLVQANGAYVTGKIYKQEAFVKQHVKSYARYPQSYFTPIFKSKCFNVYYDAQQSLAEKADGKNNIIATLLDDIKDDFLNQVCTVAADTLDTLVNNALNSLCIPIPDLDYFTLTLPNVEETTCDGVSMADLMQFPIVPGEGYGSRVPSSYLSRFFIRHIDVDTGTDIGVSSSSY
ncbi:MAG: hypothetical protein AB7E52_04650 [Bdellovibrionales bacterium]